MTLPERIRLYLFHFEPAVQGQGGGTVLFKASCALVWGFALSPEQALPYLQEFNQRSQPPWKDYRLEHKLNQAFKHRGHKKHRGHLLGENVSNDSVHPVSQCLPNPEPTWPSPDLDAIDAIVSSGRGLYDLWESSPVRFDDGNSHADEVIDVLFPANPLLCVGETQYKFATQRREDWRGILSEQSLIVPTPQLSVWGKTLDGKPSQHTKEATGKRFYLVVEFDFTALDNTGKPTRWAKLIPKWRDSGIEVVDACASLILHLREQLLSLACCTFSGGKSLHGWFRVFDLSPEGRKEFMRKAVSLGADKATWVRSQFVRLPDGRRDDGRRQTCYYLDPMEAVKI